MADLHLIFLIEFIEYWASIYKGVDGRVIGGVGGGKILKKKQDDTNNRI